jgi:CheY-like chemotaxis protein
VSEEALWLKISDELGIPFIERVPPCNLSGLPEGVTADKLDKFGCIPLQKNGRIASIICVDPKRVLTLGLGISFGRHILAPWSAISKAIEESRSIFFKADSFKNSQPVVGSERDSIAIEIIKKIIQEAVEVSANEVIFEFFAEKINYSYSTNLNQLKSGEIDSRISTELLKSFNRKLAGNVNSLPYNIVPTVEFLASTTTKVRLSWNRTQKSDSPQRLSPLVVVVDDNPVFLKVIAKYLNANGFSCEIFEKARQAVSWIAEQPGRISAIICDIHMPEVDGYRFMKEIKGDPRLKDIPVVALTSDTDTAVELEALRLGVDAFATKDEDPEIILLHIRRLTKRLEAV